MPPLLNQSPSQPSLPVDAANATESPPPGVWEDESEASCLASIGNLPGENLMAVDDNILGVYQDWLHKNTGTHLDGRIKEDGKWQEG